MSYTNLAMRLRIDSFLYFGLVRLLFSFTFFVQRRYHYYSISPLSKVTPRAVSAGGIYFTERTYRK